MPCGKMSSPLPKLFTSFPDESNFRMVGSSEISPVARFRHVLAPHRSATQIDRPSRSMSTALVDPQVRPSGIFAQPSMVRYGLSWAASQAGDGYEQDDGLRIPAHSRAMYHASPLRESFIHLTMSATKPRIQAAEELEPRMARNNAAEERGLTRRGKERRLLANSHPCSSVFVRGQYFRVIPCLSAANISGFFRGFAFLRR